MPSITDQSTVNLIASTFCNNGRVKSTGLITVGYDDEYARSGPGLKIYENVRVKEAIKRIDDKIEAKFDWDRDQNLKHQKKQIDRYEKILDAHPDNLQAMQGLNAVLRELNASSNQHSTTVNLDVAKAPPPIAKDVLEEFKATSVALTIIENSRKAVESEVINDEV